MQNLQKPVVYLSSSQKKTQVEKTNRLKRSLGSQYIEILKSAIFRVFSTDDGAVFFILLLFIYSVADGGQIFSNKL